MTPPSIVLKRHYRKLSSKERDEVVEAVADLIVRFVRNCRGDASPRGSNQKPRQQKVPVETEAKE